MSRSIKRGPTRGALLLAIFFASLSAPHCSDGLSSGPVENTRGIKVSFEEFEAGVYREPGGVYIVNGDTPIPNIEELRVFYEKYVQRGALIVHQEQGVDAKWDDSQKRNITYCVSTGLGAHYDTVVKAMADATSAWQSAADIRFVYVPSEDVSCSYLSYDVVFDVGLAPPDAPYLARAFFPSFARQSRNVLIHPDAFTSGPPITLTGILRHELGHALGFRHEHTRPESGACYEDDSWRALTAYDSASVMHYPFCNGTNMGDFVLTQKDRLGASLLYGLPEVCSIIQRGAGGVVEDTYISSAKPDASFGAHAAAFTGATGKNAQQALVRFDLSSLPEGAAIRSATVTLRSNNAGDSAIQVHRATSAWSENGATWTSFAGAYAPEVMASFAAPGPGDFVSFDAKDLAAGWLVSGNYGMLLENTGKSIGFRTSEHHDAASRPKLDVCYVVMPPPPAGWTCDEDAYNADDGCHCACGAPDLDCFKLPYQAVVGCGPDESCDPSGACVSGPPASWHCPKSFYDANDGCDCECGAPDPDCDKPNQPIFGCGYDEVCNDDGHCVPAPPPVCGDGAVTGGEQCDPPDGVTCDNNCEIIYLCGDGVVTGNEQCDPPDGVTCDNNCNIITAPEAACENLSDDDYDGLIDCQDPTDCRTLPACAPGATPAGGPCATNNDCQASANDPVCLSEGFGFPQGYCSEFCDLGGDACPAGSICNTFVLPTGGICFDTCESDADCRAGYSCRDDYGLGVLVCWP